MIVHVVNDYLKFWDLTNKKSRLLSFFYKSNWSYKPLNLNTQLILNQKFQALGKFYD